MPINGGFMDLNINDYNDKNKPLIFTKMAFMDSKELTELFFSNNIHPKVIIMITKILLKRREYIGYVRDYFMNFKWDEFIKYLENDGFSNEFKSGLVKLYFNPYCNNAYKDLFNNSKITLSLKELFILKNRERIDFISAIKGIDDKKLRLFFIKNYIKKDNVIKTYSYLNDLEVTVANEVKEETNNLFYNTVKAGNIRDLLFYAIFIYEDENLLNQILLIKNLKKENIAKYFDEYFVIEALKKYGSDNNFINDLVNNNYNAILKLVKHISITSYRVLSATDKGMEIYLEKSRILFSIKNFNIKKILDILESTLYSNTLKEFIINTHHDKIIAYFKSINIDTYINNYKYMFAYSKINIEIINILKKDMSIIDILKKLTIDDVSKYNKSINELISSEEKYFHNFIDQIDFRNFSFLNNRYAVSSVVLKKVFKLNEEYVLEKFKNIDTDILNDKIYNEDIMIKNFALKVLYPNADDRENINALIDKFSYDSARKFYDKIKYFTNELGIDLKLYIQYGLSSGKPISVMESIINENRIAKYKEFKTFLDENYYYIINDAKIIENVNDSLELYSRFYTLLDKVDLNNISDKDKKNLLLLIKGKTAFSYYDCPESLEFLNDAIIELNNKYRRYVSDNKDSNIKLSQLFSHITSLKNSEIEKILDTVGGITGLKTLEYNNIENEMLISNIEEIINIVSIVSKNNLKSEVLVYILNNLLSEEDNLIKDIYSDASKLTKMIRNVFEMEANYNLTKLKDAGGLIDKDLTRKYGVTTYDFSKVNYCLYAHVKSDRESIKDLVNGLANGKRNYISFSPISYLGQKYYYDYSTEILLYDFIPEGSYICSSMSNMGTNYSLSNNSYCSENLSSNQKGILETSSVKEHNSETLLYRKDLKPVAIALPGGRKPTETELNYAKTYNLSFVVTQKVKTHIENPINYFKKERVLFNGKNNKKEFYDDFINLLNYKEDSIYTGREIMILTDIHALLEPTIALLTYAKNRGIKEIYSLGDNITVGPNPLEVLEILEKYNVRSILGNSECYFLNDYQAFSYFDNEREQNCNWTLDKIGSRVNDLKYYDVFKDIMVGDKKVGLVHFANDIRWDYEAHSTWTFQGAFEDRARQFLYTNSNKSKYDMQKIIDYYGINHPHSKIVIEAMKNPLFNGKPVTSYDDIYEGHVHFNYEDKLLDTNIHTLEMACKDDFASAIILKEKKDGAYEEERVFIPFNKESMMGKIYSSDMPSKEKILMYTQR